MREFVLSGRRKILSGRVTNVGITVASDAITAIASGTVNGASPWPSRYATTLSINVIARSEWPFARLVHCTTEPGVRPAPERHFRKHIAILGHPNWPIERTGKDHQPDGRHFGPATFSVVLLKKVMNSASICQSLDAIPPTVAMPVATLQNARLSQTRLL